jgi:hypothetical protein
MSIEEEEWCVRGFVWEREELEDLGVDGAIILK